MEFAAPEEDSLIVDDQGVMVPLDDLIQAIVMQRPLLCSSCCKQSGDRGKDGRETHC